MKHTALFSAAVVLIACFAAGCWIAHHKHIWNDEFYTAYSSVDHPSYIDQLAGRIPEGNNTPLFYLLQKSFCQVIHYQIPPAWRLGQWTSDRQAQIVLRIVPIACMSLSMALIFFYFASVYSWWMAVYSIFLYLSTYMLWVYWAEARPYALIVLLTTVQSIVLLKMIDRPKQINTWKWLAAVHTMMAFTFIFSIGPIAAASLMVYVNKERDWKKYIFLSVIPIVIAFFYYSQAPKYSFYFDFTPEQLIRDSMPRERFYILFIFMFFFATYWIGSRIAWKQSFLNKEILKPAGYFFFTLLILVATGSVLGIFMTHQCQPGKGFTVSNRYFIYLMPVGVIAAGFMTYALIKALSSYRWAQWITVVLILSLVIPKFFKIVPKAIHSILGS